MIPLAFPVAVRSVLMAATLAVGGLMAAAHGVSAAASISGLEPADPQPDAAALKPGLAVTYHYGFVRHIDELATIAKYSKGEPGEPLPQLNYHVGQGNVLTSKFDNGVGAIIEGLINFPEAGTYILKTQSNDGIHLEIGGKLIHRDPGVHSDTFSDPIPVQIDTPGWYPLGITYFERKATSTLELYWGNPGSADAQDLVPPEAFAHLPK
jgi:hypothetical protein